MSIAETSTLMIITDQAVKIRHLEKENKILNERVIELSVNEIIMSMYHSSDEKYIGRLIGRAIKSLGAQGVLLNLNGRNPTRIITDLIELINKALK